MSAALAVAGVVLAVTAGPAGATTDDASASSTGVAAPQAFTRLVPQPVTLWESTRSGQEFVEANPPADTGSVARTISRDCVGGRSVYMAEVSTWTASSTRTVMAEQVSTDYVTGPSLAPGNLAVFVPGSTVAVCLTGVGLQRSERISVSTGQSVRMVEFFTDNESPYATHRSSLSDITSVRTPANDRLAGAVTVSSLPFTKTVDNRMATTTAGEDWTPWTSPGMLCGNDPEWEGLYTFDRTLWYRYTPTKDETLVVESSSGTATPVVGELGSTGVTWLPCKGQVASVAEGHTYVIAVGDLTVSKPHLMAAMAPATVTIRAAQPSTRTLGVTLTTSSSDLTTPKGTVTCPSGRTFRVRGTATWGATGAPDTFEASGACTGKVVSWTASAPGAQRPGRVLVVALVSTKAGATTVVGPAAQAWDAS